MTAILQAVAGFDGLPVLVAAVFAAGMVRGFTGFGTALVYVPVAATVLPPVQVIVTIITFDILGPLPVLPRALREGDPREVARLLPGAVVGLAAGLMLLTRLGPLTFRWMICIVSLLLLLVLASGWRYRRALGDVAKGAVGLVSGLFGGAAGAAGPPVILFYLGGTEPPARIRANILLFLAVFDVFYLALLAWKGLLGAFPVALGLVLILPYALGVLAGQAAFDPARERVYRGVAYVVIAVAALGGLPVFD